MTSNPYCSCQCANCLDNFHCYVIENGCHIVELDDFVDGMTADDIIGFEEFKKGFK